MISGVIQKCNLIVCVLSEAAIGDQKKDASNLGLLIGASRYASPY
jgi:hypothetical protein